MVRNLKLKRLILVNMLMLMLMLIHNRRVGTSVVNEVLIGLSGYSSPNKI